ncbi:MAG: LAGLIDADG family homing endonuclease [Candidatus Brockarchaeota archaeon]|nr:LAGLIDADG family homing endonuclease [Candidatus Brockarchaeota archaeon]
MGGGTRQDQTNSRSGLSASVGSYGTQCPESKLKECLQIGEYIIEHEDNGYSLKKERQLLGMYKEATILTPERALFKLDKGMLLEVSPKGIRKVLSPAKAGILGFINSDGSLTYSTKPNVYMVRFGSCSDELLVKFNEFMNEVYGIRLPMYRRKDRRHFIELVKENKEMVQDLANYTSKPKGDWNVPFEYLDKESAKMFLKCFMSGDGGIGYYKKSERPTPRLEVRFFSMNRKGLEEIATLLREYFGISSSHIYEKKKGGFELWIIRVDDKIKYIKEIGSFKISHIEAIERALRRIEPND